MGRPVPHTPIWIMRQAGRYLPEYRAIRADNDFLTVMKTPELAAEVTLQPVRRFPLDAAILFADIMTPVEGMGFELDFAPGPIVQNPVREARDVDRVTVADPEETCGFVLETIGRVRSELPSGTPLIGFAGAPFTLLCYLVEGSGSKSFERSRAFLYHEEQAAALLLQRLAETQTAYLRAQHAAGAQALMLFDSWIGLVGPVEYTRWIRPHVASILGGLQDLDVPIIYFPFGGATLLPEVRGLPADVIGIDWRTPLAHAADVLGDKVSLQGNLDPATLFAPEATLNARADAVVAEGRSARGHVFNLGHGISRHTDPDQVARLVDRVHESSAR